MAELKTTASWASDPPPFVDAARAVASRNVRWLVAVAIVAELIAAAAVIALRAATSQPLLAPRAVAASQRVVYRVSDDVSDRVGARAFAGHLEQEGLSVHVEPYRAQDGTEATLMMTKQLATFDASFYPRYYNAVAFANVDMTRLVRQRLDGVEYVCVPFGYSADPLSWNCGFRARGITAVFTSQGLMRFALLGAQAVERSL